MILFRLFFEFFKIGLFAVGGGMATIPFLQDLSLRTGWYSQELITDMIAISESTPGPIGINMATYVGYTTAGFLGGLIATLGEILPAIIIVTLVSKSLQRFSDSKQVGYIFYGLRPAVTGLIAAAGFDVFKIVIVCTAPEITSIVSLISPYRLLYFVVVFVMIHKLKWHPIIFIALSAVLGIFLSPLFT
ncbi:chromate transporter [Hominicoprocola fusiformis]|mgnify:CR=1 FL=1|jgi:chromate transporter